MESSHNFESNFSWLSVLKAIWFFLEDQRKKWVWWNVVIFIVHFYELIPPILIGFIVNFFTSYQDGDTLAPFYWYSAILVASYIVIAITRLTSKNVLGGISVTIAYHAKVKGFARLMDYSLAWHSQENSGNKVQRIQIGGDSLKEGVHYFYSEILKFLATFSGILATFFVLNYQFIVVFVIYMIIFVIIVGYFNDETLRLNRELKVAREHSSGTLYESAGNIVSIKALGSKESVSLRVSDREAAVRDLHLRVRDLGILKWKYFQTINGITLGVFLLLIGHGVVAKTISIGFILVYYTYLNRLKSVAGDFMNIFDKLIDMRTSIARFMGMFQDSSGIDRGKKRFPLRWSQIEIRNGSFAYEIKEKSFEIHNLNFIIHRGEKIGVAGHSGGGKSTLAKLLLGMYRLESGSFMIGTQNAAEIKHEEITSHISVVPQETELFNMTLRENIVLMKELPGGLFEKALKIAQLEPVIQKLPQGAETLIGEKGYRLSGGERQRVGIARAICRNSEVLILDEATSSLDSKTESAILGALESELQGKTFVIIAHRLSTLKNTDRIIVFEKGQIIEEGTFSGLLKNESSHFAELYRIQKETMKE